MSDHEAVQLAVERIVAVFASDQCLCAVALAILAGHENPADGADELRAWGSHVIEAAGEGSEPGWLRAHVSPYVLGLREVWVAVASQLADEDSEG